MAVVPKKTPDKKVAAPPKAGTKKDDRKATSATKPAVKKAAAKPAVKKAVVKPAAAKPAGKKAAAKPAAKTVSKPKK